MNLGELCLFSVLILDYWSHNNNDRQYHDIVKEIYHDCEITRCKLFSSNQTTTKIDTSIPYLINFFVHLSFFVFRSAETCLT